MPLFSCHKCHHSTAINAVVVLRHESHYARTVDATCLLPEMPLFSCHGFRYSPAIDPTILVRCGCRLAPWAPPTIAVALRTSQQWKVRTTRTCHETAANSSKQLTAVVWLNLAFFLACVAAGCRNRERAFCFRPLAFGPLFIWC